MTTPMTPRDPFTDEDVRKALDAWDNPDVLEAGKSMRLALLAGTERLRAQGTWNEAIEAAAKYHDEAADKLAKALAQYRREQNGEKVRELTLAVDWHRLDATRIRALKRPEAP